MPEPLPIVLVPGLLCSPRVYAEQLPALWRVGPVFVADPVHDDSMAAIAARILADAPRRFALLGISMGGYISFEILRQAPERVVKVGLLDTTARPDRPEQTERRRRQIELTRQGRFSQIPDLLYPLFVHRARRDDGKLKAIIRAMAEETGPEAFIRQQTAIMTRPDSRPTLGEIRCPALVLVGDGDELIAPDQSGEIARGIPDARLVTIADSGHLPPLEQPQQVTRALIEWLTA